MNILDLSVVGVPEHFNLAWRRIAARRALEGLGVALDWREVREGTGEMVDLLASGEADMALLLTEGAVAAVAGDRPIRLLGPWVASPLCWGVHVAADSALRTPEDLVGRRFAISRRGSGSHLMGALYADGWPSPPEFVVVDHLDGAHRALAEGRAELFLWERFMTQPLVDAGHFRRVDEILTPWPCFAAAVGRDLAPETLAAARLALSAAQFEARTIAQSPAAVDLFASEFDLVASEVSAWLASTRWADVPSLAADTLRDVGARLIAAGIIERAPDPASLLVAANN